MIFFFQVILLFLTISSSKAISSSNMTSSLKMTPSSKASSSLRESFSSRVISSLQVISLQVKSCSQPPPPSSATHFLTPKSCLAISSLQVISSLPLTSFSKLISSSRSCLQLLPPLPSSAMNFSTPKPCHPPWLPTFLATNSLRLTSSSPTCPSNLMASRPASHQLSWTSSKVINQYNHFI